MTSTSDSPPTGKLRPWVVCGLLLLATMLNYMDRQALAVSLPALKAEQNLLEGRIGWIEGSFGFAFAFGSILFGWLADRWGPRVLYPLVLTGWSFAGIATAAAGQPWVTGVLEPPGSEPGTGVFYWLLGCRIALGVCEAGHWPCALLTVRALLPADKRTLGNGILQSGASIGAILVPLYIEAADRVGFAANVHLVAGGSANSLAAAAAAALRSWQFPFWSIGVLGLVWVPLWHFGVKRVPLSLRPTDPITSPDTAAPSGFWRRLAVLAAVVVTLTISWQFLRVWLVLYLQDFHGYGKTAARGLTAGYFVAADVGCLFSGALVALLTARGWGVHPARKLGYAVFTALTACGAVVPFVGDGWWMVGLLFVTGAGILGLHPYYYSLAQEISARRMGVLSGTLAAGGWVVSSLSQILLGAQIEATKSYRLGLLIVGLVPVVGLLSLILFWPGGRGKRSR